MNVPTASCPAYQMIAVVSTIILYHLMMIVHFIRDGQVVSHNICSLKAVNKSLSLLLYNYTS